MISQPPVGGVAELGLYLCMWGGSRGTLMGPCALAHPGTGEPGSKPRHAGRLDSIPGEPHVKNRFSLKTIYAQSLQVRRQCIHSNSFALMVWTKRRGSF